MGPDHYYTNTTEDINLWQVLVGNPKSQRNIAPVVLERFVNIINFKCQIDMENVVSFA